MNLVIYCSGDVIICFTSVKPTRIHTNANTGRDRETVVSCRHHLSHSTQCHSMSCYKHMSNSDRQLHGTRHRTHSSHRTNPGQKKISLLVCLLIHLIRCRHGGCRTRWIVGLLKLMDTSVPKKRDSDTHVSAYPSGPH
jgi:hypothetical protein